MTVIWGSQGRVSAYTIVPLERVIFRLDVHILSVKQSKTLTTAVRAVRYLSTLRSAAVVRLFM